MPNNSEPIDIKSIATLLNYERASTCPKFRHAKLREIASKDGKFKSLQLYANIWGDYRKRVKTGIRFDTAHDESDDELDLPDESMLYTKGGLGTASLDKLTERDLERIYWEARNHDGCYNCIEVLQSFMDLYQTDTRIRIRTAQNVDFTTTLGHCVILEYELFEPKFTTALMVMPEGLTHITGHEPSMVHAVWGFHKPNENKSSVFLDMSSLQFGDAGRGLGGKGTFAFESSDKWESMMESVAEEVYFEKESIMLNHRDWETKRRLQGIAQKVKKRWDNREKEPWCAHCGKPEPPLTCGGCKAEKYCSKSHQASQWPFHRNFCKTVE